METRRKKLRERQKNLLTMTTWGFVIVHCWKEIGDFQIICSKVGGFRPFNYLLGVTCYLLSLKCKWLVFNKLCNFTAYKLFVSTNKQLTDPMDSMADPLFSSYSVSYKAVLQDLLFWCSNICIVINFWMYWCMMCSRSRMLWLESNV